MGNLQFFSHLLKLDILSRNVLLEGLKRFFKIGDLIAFDGTLLSCRSEFFFQGHNFKLQRSYFFSFLRQLLLSLSQALLVARSPFFRCCLQLPHSFLRYKQLTFSSLEFFS